MEMQFFQLLEMSVCRGLLYSPWLPDGRRIVSLHRGALSVLISPVDGATSLMFFGVGPSQSVHSPDNVECAGRAY